MNKRYVYYETETGLIRHVKYIPEDMAEINCQDGQEYFEIDVDTPVDANTQKVGPNNTFVPYEKPYDMEQGFLKLRVERNRRLSACDWTQVPDAPVDPQPWATYRQALRDLPDGLSDPRDVVWPTPPA